MSRPRLALLLPPLLLLACAIGNAVPDSLSVPMLYAEGHYDEVLRLLSTLPSDSLAAGDAFYCGSSYAMVGNFKQSLPMLRRAVTLAPARPGFRLQLARILAQAGRGSEARVEYELLLAGDRPYTPAMTSYGIFLFEDGNIPDAFGVFQRALGANPRDYLACYYAGVCLERFGMTDSAIQYLATSTSLNAGFSPSTAMLASLRFEQENYTESLLLYERLCRQRPHMPEYWYKAGLCCEYLEDLARAVDLYRRAAVLDSTNPLYPAHCGQIFFAQNKFDSSVAAYRGAVDLDPKNPSLLLNLGLGLARLHDSTGAMQSFQRAAAAHHLDRAAVPWTQMGALLYNHDDYRKARAMYARALALDPGNMEALFFIGFAHEQVGAIDAARSAFRKFLKAAAGDPALKKRITLAEERLRKLPRKR